ncbi:Ectonucleoside triphosphate diphosphohydrolase 1 [Tyrophagus putrescentiae]|nr:Ectonucleoside triphosphate diphosphohydrolase 1 [Tyrophagus putrescentiae]
MVIALLGVFFWLFLYTATSSYSQFKYAITIDAGSTHSKAILFKWKVEKLNDTGLIKQVRTCDIKPGISSFTGDQLEKAADGLMECIHQLAEHFDSATSLEHAFVYLGATAGMRMLNLSDSQTSANLFQSIRKRFVDSGLQTKRVSIITGKEEGLFAWVAVNYLSGTFFDHIKGVNSGNRTFGVLDMGGASAQIAQQISSNLSGSGDETNDYVHIRLYGTNYTVHTYSNFCFGTEQALRRYYKITRSKHIITDKSKSTQIEAPCLPRGETLPLDSLEVDNVCTADKSAKSAATDSAAEQHKIELVGTSDFDKCQEVVNEILDPQTCETNFHYCFKESSHPKESTFFAISAYYYLTDVLKLKNEFSNIDFYQFLNATRHMCERSSAELKAMPGLNEKYLNKYCFQLIYLHSTLTKVYHFDEKTWSNLRFATYINEAYLGWVLGFMISESNAIPREEPLPEILLETNFYTIPVSFLLIVFVICAICIGRQFKMMKKMKPQDNPSPPPPSSLPMTQVA